MFYCICVSHCLIHPSDDGQFECFHVLAIVRQATLNVRVCVFQFRVFSTFRPKNEIAVSCLCSNFVFLKERACYTPQCLFQFAAATAAKSLQSCPTLCDPIDSSAPGSPVPGILQARTLEWVPLMPYPPPISVLP